MPVSRPLWWSPGGVLPFPRTTTEGGTPVLHHHNVEVDLLDAPVQDFCRLVRNRPPPRTTVGPWAQAYCRVLGGGGFL